MGLSRKLLLWHRSLLVGIAAATFGLCFGLVFRIMPPRPHASVYIGPRGGVEAMSQDGTSLLLVESEWPSERFPRFCYDLHSRVKTPLAAGIDFSNVIHLDAGRRTAVLHDRLSHELRIVDLLTGATLRSVLMKREPSVGARTVSPDGRWLCFGYYDDDSEIRAEVFDLDTMQTRHVLRGQHYKPVGFTPDGRWLATVDATGAEDKTLVTVWDLATGARVSRVTCPGTIEDVKFSRNGRALIVSGRELKPLRLYESLWHLPEEVFRLSLQAFGGSSVGPDGTRVVPLDSIQGYAVSPDGERLVVLDDSLAEARKVLVCELATGSETKTPILTGVDTLFDGHPVWVDKGRLIAIPTRPARDASGEPSWFDRHNPLRSRSGRAVLLFDTESLRFVASIPVDGTPSFTPDGSRMLVTTEDGWLQVWDLPPHRPVPLILTLAALPALLFTVLLWWRLGR